MFIHYLALLLACQLIGEVIALYLQLPVPGPVVGMALLFIGLLLKRGIPAGLARTAEGLLEHLSLLFVPAGVGVMLHASLLAEQWVALSTALLVSTVITIVVTAWIMQRLAAHRKEREPNS